MKTLAPRVLGALLLLACALPSRAATRPTRDAVDEWGGRVAQPESFSRLADGSLERSGDADAPVAAAPGSGGGRATAYWARPRATPEAFRRGAPIPTLTVSPAITPTRDRRADPLPWAAGLGVAGLVCVALFSRAPRPESPAPGPAAPLFEAPAPTPAPAAPEPPPSADRLIADYLERAPEVEPFVDARMPVGTWRAISWREQSLIERWDRSPEKAAGRASLAEWIDLHGPAAGVDAVALKGKLARA